MNGNVTTVLSISLPKFDREKKNEKLELRQKEIVGGQ